MSRHKFNHPSSAEERWKQILRAYRHRFGVARHTAFVAFMANTIGRMEHRSFNKKKATGEKIVVDKIFSPPVTQDYAHMEQQPADISPNSHLKLRKARIMKREEYPPTDYSFVYEAPPLSGNVINGVGETEPRRPRQPFFSRGYSGAWNKLERVFQSLNKPELPNFILGTFWMDRKRVGPVATRQRPVEDPKAMATEIKALARKHGAALVGIAPFTEQMRFEGFDLPFKYAISVALPMEREKMLESPSPDVSMHIQEVYRSVGLVAIKLARDIRKMGWPARASTNISPDTYEVLHIPVAVEAGLGTLGKHGSMISKEYGSNIRLATILTDIPLEVDGAQDIGVDDFCLTCQICSTNCPPQAIFDVKKMVRGEEKWYVDFDKCIPYFVEHDSCGICIEVCPWSEPGRGPLISEKMLGRREKKVAAPPQT